MVESVLRLAGLDWRVPDFSTGDGRECTIDIDGFEIKGRIAEREIHEALALALALITTQQDFLRDEWQRYNP
jgi:hypothetical protein